MKLFSITAAAIFVAGCAASSARIDPARLDALTKGRTTYDEVVQRFGKPSVVSNNVDGTRTARYIYAAAGDRKNEIVTLLATEKNDGTTFYFDTGGLLTDYKYTGSERTAVVPPATAQPATMNTAEKPASAPAASSAPAAAPKKALPPNVTDRWPGSTTENR